MLQPCTSDRFDSDAELVPLREHFVLHARSQGAIAIVNARAAEAWVSLNNSGSHAAALAAIAQSWGIALDHARALLDQLARELRASEFRSTGAVKADEGA